MEYKNKKSMSKLGFILSAIGATVGIGSIWAFPTKMAAYGGSVFLIPYIIAVLLIGLPFLILEINLGARWRQAPTSFYNNYLGKGGRSFAWAQASIQLLIGTYFAVIISWVLISIGVSFTNFLGDTGFYTSDILGQTNATDGKSFAGLGKVQPLVFVGFIFVICLSGLIVFFGVVKGIERVNKIVIPFLLLLLAVIFFYSFSLDGAGYGLDFMFKSDVSKLENLDAWKAAFSQAVFTLSLAVSIIVVYSMHAPKKGDNTNRAITIVTGDIFIVLLACVIIGSTLGYAETNNLVSFKDGEVIKDGEVLSGSAFVFKIFPIAFESINNNVAQGLGNFIAFTFYLAIFCAAISAMISLLIPAVANMEATHNIQRWKGVVIVCLIQFLGGLIFTFQGGGELIDVTDQKYTNNLLLPSLIIMGVMCIWNKNKFKELLDFNNRDSRYKLGGWFRYLLMLAIASSAFVFVYGLTSNTDSVKNINAFQWTWTGILFFLPFVFFVFGYGFSNFWISIKTRLMNFWTKSETSTSKLGYCSIVGQKTVDFWLPIKNQLITFFNPVKEFFAPKLIFLAFYFNIAYQKTKLFLTPYCSFIKQKWMIVWTPIENFSKHVFITIKIKLITFWISVKTFVVFCFYWLWYGFVYELKIMKKYSLIAFYFLREKWLPIWIPIKNFFKHVFAVVKNKVNKGYQKTQLFLTPYCVLIKQKWMIAWISFKTFVAFCFYQVWYGFVYGLKQMKKYSLIAFIFIKQKWLLIWSKTKLFLTPYCVLIKQKWMIAWIYIKNNYKYVFIFAWIGIKTSIFYFFAFFWYGFVCLIVALIFIQEKWLPIWQEIKNAFAKIFDIIKRPLKKGYQKTKLFLTPYCSFIKQKWMIAWISFKTFVAFCFYQSWYGFVYGLKKMKKYLSIPFAFIKEKWLFIWSEIKSFFIYLFTIMKIKLIIFWLFMKKNVFKKIRNFFVFLWRLIFPPKSKKPERENEINI